MNPMGYNDIGGYALFQAVKKYKNLPDVPEPGSQPGEEITSFNKRAIHRVGVWQRSRNWVGSLFRTEAPAPEIADQC